MSNEVQKIGLSLITKDFLMTKKIERKDVIQYYSEISYCIKKNS